MGSHGKVDMSTGWALEGDGQGTNVALNIAERELHEQDFSLEGQVVFPQEVSTPLVVTEHMSIGVTTFMENTITSTNWSLASTGITAPKFTLSSARWDDLRVPVTSTKLGGTKDPGFAVLRKNTGGTSQGVFCYHFDKATEEELYFTVQIPHCWKVGTDLHVHAHWCPIDTGTGTVCWAMEYTVANMNAVLPVTTTIASTPTAAPGVAYTHKMLDIGDITGTNLTVSAMLLCRIYRDVASDNYDNDAALLEVDFHYQTDTPGGSNNETSKS